MSPSDGSACLVRSQPPCVRRHAAPTPSVIRPGRGLGHGGGRNGMGTAWERTEWSAPEKRWSLARRRRPPAERNRCGRSARRLSAEPARRRPTSTAPPPARDDEAEPEQTAERGLGQRVLDVVHREGVFAVELDEDEALPLGPEEEVLEVRDAVSSVDHTVGDEGGRDRAARPLRAREHDRRGRLEVRAVLDEIDREEREGEGVFAEEQDGILGACTHRDGPVVGAVRRSSLRRIVPLQEPAAPVRVERERSLLVDG